MLGILWQIVVMPLPWALRRRLLNMLPNVRIAGDARIGLSLIDAKEIVLEDGAVIGHLTIAKGLDRLHLHSHARIGNLNWITAVPGHSATFYTHLPARDPSLVVGEHGSITHRHLIDCTGGVSIGPFATLAGWRSQVISHGFDFRASRQDAAAISIGAYAFVGSQCVLLKGSAFPAYSLLAAGSVFGEEEAASHGIFRGNPASREGDLPEDLAYFHRSRGFIE